MPTKQRSSFSITLCASTLINHREYRLFTDFQYFVVNVTTKNVKALRICVITKALMTCSRYCKWSWK